MFFVLITLFNGGMTLKWDNFYKLFIVFFLLGILSLIDSTSKLRGILFLGQWIPYFFLAIMCVSIIRSERLLNIVLSKTIILGLFFSLIVISSFILFRDRVDLNNFLLHQFNIPVNKVLTYIELPYCIVTYRMVTGRKINFNTLVFLLGLLAVVFTGSRGSLLIVMGILGLAVLKSESKIKAAIWFYLALLLLAAGLIISPYTADRFEKLSNALGEDKASAVSLSRLYTMQVAWQMIKEHPVNGVGMGNLSQYSGNASKKLSLPRAIYDYWKGHGLFETSCAPLKIGAELGVAGLIFFFVFYFTLWRRIRIAQKSTSGQALQLLTGMEIYVISSFVHNIIDLGFYNYYSWFYYGLVLAAARIYKK